jgi:hypothetical protein
MRLLAALLLFVASSAMAGGPLIDNSTNQKQHAIQVAKASQQMKVDGSPTTVTGSDYDAAAIAPNPSAHAPSAQCRYGWSVTGAGVGFGAGISASEWDDICGLWMAAQQTTGDARQEAASAAFCLTMKRSKVSSEVCKTWEMGQGKAAVAMNENQAEIVFGGVGTGGRN